MRLRLIVTSLTLVVAVASAAARQASPAQLALEAARKMEVVDRDLKSAIVRYRAVVSTYPKDRSVVPEALLGLAGCLEQLGQPEALATYERVVKEYPDTAPAKTAQKKLAAFGKEGSGLTTTLVDVTDDGAPSFAGGFMSFTDLDTGDLAVSDLKSGRARRVTTNPPGRTGRSYVWASVPSPDGRQIAYVWGDGGVDLRVIGSGGGTARVLCCEAPSPQVRPFGVIELFGWSMDSKQVLFALLGGTRAVRTTQIVAVPVAGGVPRVLKTIDGTVKRASWSPDGQFIIYDAPRVAGKTEHALFIMRADDSNSAVLIPRGFNDEMLDWFPDGKRILFVSDRLGANAVFMQRIAEGKVLGEPLRLKDTLPGTIQGQGFTRNGSYYYRTQAVLEELLTFRLGASGDVSEPAVRLPGRFANGRQGAGWSPDGSQIAYVQAPFGLGTLPTLSILTVATGQVRPVPVDLPALANPAWMPDGLALIAEGTTAQGGQGLFRIDLGSGAVSPIGETTTGATGRKRLPVVSQDGRQVFYLVDRTSIQVRDLSVGTVRVVFEGAALMAFAPSPDGRSIAVAVDARDKGFPPVLIIPIAGGTPRGLGAETDPWHTGEGIGWSPDGRWVWFTRYGVPGMPLWRVPADGGPAQHISALWKDTPQIRRLSVAPNGSMAASTQMWVNQQWVMRNIPAAVGR